MEGNEMAKSNAVSREIHAPTTGEERTKIDRVHDCRD